MQIYLLDAYEKYYTQGTVYLFGKTIQNKSICIQVSNIERNLFIIPNSTSTQQQVEHEIVQLLHSKQIRNYKFKWVTRKYVFHKTETDEYKNVINISCLKLSYLFSSVGHLSSIGSGQHFHKICGVNSTALELFLLKREIMGPTWIQISNNHVTASTTNESWATIEYQIANPKQIQVVKEHRPEDPILSNMYLSIQTQHNTNNIPTITQIHIYFQSKYYVFNTNERDLLVSFYQWLKIHDPDVIVSHDLYGQTLYLILQKSYQHQIQDWSRWGRLKRGHSDLKYIIQNKFYTFNILESGIGSGRLLIDSMSSAIEFLPHQDNYSLEHLAKTQLNIPNITNELDICRQLLDHMKIIELTKDMSHLCGSLWSRTVRSNRSERIEYLLLHFIHKLKYIIPEKQTRKTNVSTTAAKYEGGLVLEPKHGYYDQLVLLLDFHSLYPSIIQEFNICFSTLPYWNSLLSTNTNTDTSLNTDQGFLPSIVKRLISERNAVKQQLSQSNQSNATELNIRQKALKLVANSLYGCLGFQNSRFYCESLAALITHQGRDILRHAIHIVEEESKGQVIYGDTDSLLILIPQVTDMTQLVQISESIAQRINQTYSVLEIGLDSIFKSLLLMDKKKKYGALKWNGSEFKLDMKGLEIIRRDWCGLWKTIGEYVLQTILHSSKQDMAKAASTIFTYLKQCYDQMCQNQISIEQYIITKQLTKSIEEYTDAKSQPHVQVAIQMMSYKQGDFIPYIIGCNLQDTNALLATKAYHPSRISLDKIDKEWYIHTQILPPLLRLCASIPELDPHELRSCFGIIPVIATTSTVELKHKQSKISNHSITDLDLWIDLYQERVTSLYIDFLCCDCNEKLSLQSSLKCSNPMCECTNDSVECLERITNYIKNTITDTNLYLLSYEQGLQSLIQHIESSDTFYSFITHILSYIVLMKEKQKTTYCVPCDVLVLDS